MRLQRKVSKLIEFSVNNTQQQHNLKVLAPELRLANPVPGHPQITGNSIVRVKVAESKQN